MYGFKGDNDRAIQDYDQAIQFDPKDVVAYASRGGLYKIKGDNSRAIQDFDQAIQLDPKNVAPYWGRGGAYESKGDHDRAIQDYNQAIELDPTFAFAYAGRGDAYRSKGEQERAIQDYDKAIQLNPINPKMSMPMSVVGASTTARGTTTVLSMTITRRSSSIRKMPTCTETAVSLNRAKATWTVLSRTTTRRSSSMRKMPTCTETAASLTSSKGDLDRAIKDYDQAIQLDAKDALAYVLRGINYMTKGDSDRAVQDFDQAIQVDPKFTQAYVSRGFAYSSKGDHDRAIQDLDQAIHLDAKFSRLTPAAVWPILEKATRPCYPGLRPGNPTRFQRRRLLPQPRRSLGSKGDNDRAIQDYDRAIQLDPKNAGAHRSRGFAYFYQGNFKAAAAALSARTSLRKTPIPLFGAISRGARGREWRGGA